MAIDRPDRRGLLLGMAAASLSAPALAAQPWPLKLPSAGYKVELLSTKPLRFSVTASLLPADRLTMTESYPAELPSMARRGWPSLISDLVVSDTLQAPVEVVADGAKGWRVPHPPEGRMLLSYTVDFGVFQEAGWSSPLESAVADDEHIMACCRALYIVTPRVRDILAGFIPSADWQPVAPWAATANGMHAVEGPEDLTDNMLVFTRGAPDIATAAGFSLQIIAMGHWAPLRPLIRESLTKIIAHEVALTGWRRPETYNVVLVPTADQGGEAYRQSFAYCFKDPTADNRAQWANTLAHEILHYWNYARLKGADYASTQWFQEGFTEYAANLTLVQAGITTPEQFVGKLDGHLANARKLTTTLENIGTRKGPPLYSAGALTAFCFDVMLRHASGRRRDIGDLFRGLLKATGEGERSYAWADIRAVLTAAAPGEDWEGFYRAHIRGAEPLPLARVLPMAGLMLSGERIVGDIKAPVAARRLWAGLVRGR